MQSKKLSKFNGDDVLDVVRLMKMTLTIYQFLYQERMPISTDKNSQGEVIKFMNLMRKVLRKSVKNQGDDPCQFPKFHYLLHICPMILNFGSARNFDGGPCESNHKYLSKVPGKRSQCRTDTFDEQTSYNLAAQMVLERACDSANVTVGKRRGTLPVDNEGIENDEKVNVHPNSSNFDIKKELRKSVIVWNKNQVPGTKSFGDDILKFANQILFGNGDILDTCVPGFTCLKYKGNIIRAHPCYRSGDCWHDYVNLMWGEYICPAKVLMYVDLRTCRLKAGGDLEPGLYAIVHSTFTDPRNHNKPHQHALKVWRDRGKSGLFKFWTMEKVFRLVGVNTFSSVCYVVPDFKDKDMTISTDFVIEVKPKDEWKDLHM